MVIRRYPKYVRDQCLGIEVRWSFWIWRAQLRGDRIAKRLTQQLLSVEDVRTPVLQRDRINYLPVNHCMLAKGNDFAWRGDDECGHHRARLFSCHRYSFLVRLLQCAIELGTSQPITEFRDGSVGGRHIEGKRRSQRARV